MPSSHKNERRRGAPTRPAETSGETDRFETQVYQKDANLFYTLHNDRYPNGLDFVLVETRDGSPALEIYDGQNFMAVLRILDFYKLPNGSEQTRREIFRRRPP